MPNQNANKMFTFYKWNPSIKKSVIPCPSRLTIQHKIKCLQMYPKYHHHITQHAPLFPSFQFWCIFNEKKKKIIPQVSHHHVNSIYLWIYGVSSRFTSTSNPPSIMDPCTFLQFFQIFILSLFIYLDCLSGLRLQWVM